MGVGGLHIGQSAFGGKKFEGQHAAHPEGSQDAANQEDGLSPGGKMKDMGKKIVYAKSEGKEKGKTTNDRKGKKPLQESLDGFIGFAFCQKRGKADSG